MLEVYVLTWVIGYECGQKRLIGIYSTFERAEQEKKKYLQENLFGDCSINAIPLDKTVDIKYLDW